MPDLPDNNKDFLGKGMRFPFQFTRRTGGVFKGTSVSETEAERHIEESIIQILGTKIGSRVIRRDFGSMLRGIVFDPNDPQLDVQIDYIIRSAIEKWEPRVIVGPITIDRSEWKDGRIEIDITFTIIKTNVTRNMVFPFFLSEEQRKTFVTPAG